MDESETLSFIANRTKGLCDEFGISLKELATRSGLSSSTIFALLNGKHTNPRIDTISKIAKSFSLTLGEFWAIS